MQITNALPACFHTNTTITAKVYTYSSTRSSTCSSMVNRFSSLQASSHRLEPENILASLGEAMPARTVCGTLRLDRSRPADPPLARQGVRSPPRKQTFWDRPRLPPPTPSVGTCPPTKGTLAVSLAKAMVVHCGVTRGADSLARDSPCATAGGSRALRARRRAADVFRTFCQRPYLSRSRLRRPD